MFITITDSTGHFPLFLQENKTTIHNVFNGYSMSRLKVYSTGTCPVCENTKALLKKWGITYEEVRVDLDKSALREFSHLTNGARTVPQISIDGKWIGGFTELTELHMDNALDDLML